MLPEHLPPALLKAVESQTSTEPPPAPVPPPAANGARRALPSEVEALEKAQILEALERCAGNQSRAARMLGISRGKLIARLDAFDITRPRKREDAPG